MSPARTHATDKIEGWLTSEKREYRTKTHMTHKSIWINKSLVSPKSTSNQSSKPYIVLQYPSRKALRPDFVEKRKKNFPYGLCLIASGQRRLSRQKSEKKGYCPRSNSPYGLWLTASDAQRLWDWSPLAARPWTLEPEEPSSPTQLYVSAHYLGPLVRSGRARCAAWQRVGNK